MNINIKIETIINDKKIKISLFLFYKIFIKNICYMSMVLIL